MPQSNGKNLLKRFEFEFKGNSYYFILNPEEYQQTEISRSTITQTMGGGWIDAFGAGLMEITLKGSTGFKNTSGNPSDGFERFKQLRDLIRSVYSNVKMGEEVKDLMKFYNYTDNEYWEVYPSRFQLMRSKSKPLLYMYDIQLTALRQLSDAKPYNGRIGNPFVVQSTVMETNDMNVENIENSNIIEDISLLETLPVFNLFPKLRDRIAKSISHFSSKVIDVISQGVKNEELLSDFNTLLVVGNNIAELVGGTNGLISPAVSKYILSGLNILNNGTATNLQDNENQNKPNENKNLKRTFLLNNFYSEQTDQSSKNSNTELGTVELYFVPQVSRKAYTLFKELKSLNPKYFQLDKFIPLITDYIPTDKQVEKENLVSLIANLDNQAIDSSIVKYIRVPLKKPYTIIKGTKFATSSIGKTKYFISKEDTIVPQNSTEIMVLVECTERGTQGNVPANTINIMTNPNSEIVKVTNPYDFTNGTERETPAERKKRFRDYIKTLARGTVDAITYGCLEVEGVTGVWVDDSNIGFVKVYAHDIDGNLPDELKQKIIENERNYRAAGVEVEVLPVIKRSIDIYVKIYIAKDYDTAMYYTIISSAIYKYLNTFQVSNVLYLSELIQYIMNIDDVAISNVEVIKPYDDIVAGEQELIRSGNIVVEVYNV